MKIRYSYLSVVFCCLIFLSQVSAGCLANSRNEAALEKSEGSFMMKDPTGVTTADLQVFYYRPEKWTSDRSVVIVQHGFQRNGKEYRDGWKEYADKYNILVICPEFSEEKYPGAQYYNMGNMSDTDNEKGNLQPKEKWTFSVIDHVVDEVKQHFKATGEFVLFGHSAGAQFVHRYMLFSGHDKFSNIIVANAGWYTMLNRSIDFPYGIKNIPMSDTQLTKIFAKPVTILLGEKDNDPNHKLLRHTRLADEQGMNRFDRGMQFFNQARAKAGEMGVQFKWKIITVPGVGHNDLGMAQAAAQLIFENQ